MSDGADLVVDPVGDRWADPALRAVRWGGRFVTLGYAGGDIPRIPQLEDVGHALQRVADRVPTGKVVICVSS